MTCALISFFFFSSRRRHTRLVSDWSSDVCSSDLGRQPGAEASVAAREEAAGGQTIEEAMDVEPMRDRLVDDGRVVGQHLVQLTHDPARIDRARRSRRAAFLSQRVAPLLVVSTPALGAARPRA